MDRTVEDAFRDGTADRSDDKGSHDGFFFLDDLDRTELLDIRETALETGDRVNKLVAACARRLDTCG